MLHYSFSTILMTLLASSIIISFIAVVFLHKNIMVRVGYKLMIFCIGLILFRLMLPFEFPFTRNVFLPGLAATILAFPQWPITYVLGIKISLWTLFEVVWAAGIIFHAVRYKKTYRCSMNYILKYGNDKTDNPKYQTILTQLCTKYNRKNNFHVMEMPNLKFPIIWGVTTPYIVLPDQLSLSSDQLYFVLCHEVLHYFHHDLLLKSIIRILSIIYWWNPVCILLQKQANALLEMRIDEKVTQKDPILIKSYTSCLLHIQKNTSQNALQIPSSLNKDALSLLHPQKKNMTKRFDMLFQSSTLWKRICTGTILVVLAAGIYLTSYLYILEADYYPSKFEEMGIIVASSENTYFIKIDESRYKVYFNDIYTETITSLQYYPKGIKIYNEEGVLINET